MKKRSPAVDSPGLVGFKSVGSEGLKGCYPEMVELGSFSFESFGPLAVRNRVK